LILTIDDLKQIQEEMEEAEMMRNLLWSYNWEHEDAGDRD